MPSPHIPWRLVVVGNGVVPTADLPGSHTEGFAHLRIESELSPVGRVRMLRDKLRELQADVVSPNFLLEGFVAAAIDHHRGRRVAALWHGSELAAENLYRRAAPLADAWRAVSLPIAVRVSRYGRPSNPNPVLPTGVDVPALVSLAPGVDDRRAPIKILFAAWLDDRNKRVMDLVPFADTLARLHVDFQLTIAGRGPAQQALQRELAPHVRAGRVRMPGPVAPAKMHELYESHDALILVSASEGTPVVVMEAMAHGRPVLISRGCGGALRAVKNGVEGFIADVGDVETLAHGVLTLFKDRNRLAMMAHAAHAAAKKHFALSSLAPRYDELVLEAYDTPTRVRADRPGEVADHWDRILAALEVVGPCDAQELLLLALEWLDDLGAPRVHLHLSAGAPALLSALASPAAEIIRGIVTSEGDGRGAWAGWPAGAISDLKSGSLVLTDEPERIAPYLPEGVHAIALRLPGLPDLSSGLFRDAVRRAKEFGVTRIALYGAGKHTRRLAKDVANTPEIVAILDDRAGTLEGPPTRLWGIPVIKPEDMSLAQPGAVIVSSDEFEHVMLPRARELAPNLFVTGLYENLLGPGGELSRMPA